MIYFKISNVKFFQENYYIVLAKTKTNAKIKESFDKKMLKVFCKKNLTKKKINDKILKCQIDTRNF